MEDDLDPSFLEINVFLTRSLDLQSMTNVYLSAGDRVDGITELKSRTRFGRPNFEEFFLRLQKDNRPMDSKKRRQDVGVFLCGPVSIA